MNEENKNSKRKLAIFIIKMYRNFCDVFIDQKYPSSELRKEFLHSFMDTDFLISAMKQNFGEQYTSSLTPEKVQKVKEAVVEYYSNLSGSITDKFRELIILNSDNLRETIEYYLEDKYTELELDNFVYGTENSNLVRLDELISNKDIYRLIINNWESILMNPESVKSCTSDFDETKLLEKIKTIFEN